MPSSSQDSAAWRGVLGQLEDSTAALAASGNVHDEDTRKNLLRRSDAIAGAARLIRDGRLLLSSDDLEQLPDPFDSGGSILDRFRDERDSILSGLAQVGRDTQTVRFFERPHVARKRDWSG